jgi:hypothetical protein
MKKNYPSFLSATFLFSLLLISSSTIVFASGVYRPMQSLPDTTSPDVIPGKIYSPAEVDTKAEFSRGLTAWGQYIGTSVNPLVPIYRGAPDGVYTVKVFCTVTKKGRLRKLKAQTKNGYGMENEFMRALRKSPDWIPARIKGQNVDCYTILSFTFKIFNGNAPRP